MDYTSEFNQLSDIIVDWCQLDLERMTAHPAGIVSHEMLRCMLFTLTHDPDARRIFENLLAEERREWIAAHPE